MNGIAKSILGSLVLASGLWSAAAGAQEIDLGGVWQSDNGESRYELSWCGPKGTSLCAILTWIRPDMVSDRNREYIGRPVVDEARLAGVKPLSWDGKINVYGTELDGHVTLVNPDRFVVKGCAFVIFCVEDGAVRMPDKSASN